MIKRTCQICGTEFYTWLSEIKKQKGNGGKYCSRSCHHEGLKGKSMTEEAKEKLRINRLGNKNPMFNVRLFGPQNGNWKGGRIKNNRGHILLMMKEHPNANKQGYVKEHTLIATKILGRPLNLNEIVHHHNRDPKDNRNENLLICTPGYHHFIHHKMRRKGFAPHRKSPKRSPLKESTKQKISKSLKIYYQEGQK